MDEDEAVDEDENEGKDVKQVILLMYHRCKYMIGDHNEKRKVPCMHTLGVLYLSWMTFVLRFFTFWTISTWIDFGYYHT